MATSARALSLSRLRRPWTPSPGPTGWMPVWSVPAAMRAVRTTLVMPTLFVITSQVIGNAQMATFAAFGSFATLVLAAFGGGWRDKLVAHAGLALAGSLLLTIGTLVSSSTLLAAVVSVPVAFAVFFGGVIGPNAASGAIAALLPYVLPAASPGTVSMIPDRLAGWLLASVVGTAAVLLLSPPSPGDKLKRAAAKLASELVSELEAMLRGDARPEQLEACIAAKHDLLAQFTATPYRPTGLGAADQALANAVELLEWCTSLVADSVRERSDLSDAPEDERELLEVAAGVLRDAGTLLGGGDARPDLERLEECRVRSIARLHDPDRPQSGDLREQAQISFHAHAIAVTILAIGADAVVAAGVADPEWVAEQGTRWFGASTFDPPPGRRLSDASRAAGYALRHASVRSVWFINSLRASVAIAAAVAIADLSSVQHGFWVVLGTLSVLRTNAGSTGSTALRALAGTLGGFVIGGALILAIGTNTTVLWVALPIAVFVAAYAPGTAPFAVGQAAFTVTIAVLFNLLAPVGWKVGVIRIEDVAIGCAVSVAVGILFWPRGVTSVVGDDLADAYRTGAMYLTQAVEWVSGLAAHAPNGARAAVTAGVRLDDALRGLLAEQGSKRIRKEDLWRLVGGSLRLRLTAHAVAGLPRVDGDGTGASPTVLNDRTSTLQAWYDNLAAQVDRPRGQAIATLTPPDLAPRRKAATSPRAVWLCEHLDHLADHLGELVVPATRVAEVRRRPWWR
ncbi:MAG TPA: FUSC family protein [Solirubrobacteraceae bacterium]|nr:FUSC family protein [Solirubrobacteraceae bacterium]